MRKKIEEMALRAFKNSIAKIYIEVANYELENRQEYNEDIKLQKCELRNDYEEYKIKLIKEGLNDGSLKVEDKEVLPINTTGEEKIKLIKKAFEELDEDLENVESYVYINEEFQCDLNVNYRGDYVDIIENLINFTDYKSEELRKEYLESLSLEIEKLDEIKKQIAIKVGELLITSLLDKRCLNEYDMKVDKILSEII